MPNNNETPADSKTFSIAVFGGMVSAVVFFCPGIAWAWKQEAKLFFAFPAALGVVSVIYSILLHRDYLRLLLAGVVGASGFWFIIAIFFLPGFD